MFTREIRENKNLVKISTYIVLLLDVFNQVTFIGFVKQKYYISRNFHKVFIFPNFASEHEIAKLKTCENNLLQ